MTDKKPIWKSKTAWGIALLAVAFFAERNGFIGVFQNIIEYLGWGSFGIGLVDKVQHLIEKK